MTPGGWPNWDGEIVAIIASGPTAKKANFEALRGVAKIIAIKENIDLCPWADAVYGCDAAWWEHRKGLPDFKGLKVCWAGGLQGFPDIRRIEIEKTTDRLLLEQTGKTGSGGNSGFQALNLSVQWGPPRGILLVGFDMTDQSGVHWYGRNGWRGANNPDQNNFKRWLAAFDAVAPILAGLGVEVVNTSQVSAMRCFPRRSIEDMLAEWQ